MNLKDVDLRDFFRLIHEISGLNVVVDPSVKGTLTIVLDDVPWDQALDIVLHNNDLDKQLDGNVLRIATKDTLRKEAEESRDLARAQAEAADIVTTTRRLSYAKATTIATTMKKFLSSRGDILADDRSNTLIIRDIPTTFPCSIICFASSTEDRNRWKSRRASWLPTVPSRASWEPSSASPTQSRQ